MPHVTRIYVYPVKSLRGYSVPMAEMDLLGLAGDRRFLIIDAHGGMLTQRTWPRMALIGARLTAKHLLLSADGFGDISVLRAADAPAALVTVSVWRSAGLLTEDCGDTVAQWLSAALQQTCRLVRIGERFHRPVLKQAAMTGDVTSFVDGSPILIISDASLANLNDRIVVDSS